MPHYWARTNFRKPEDRVIGMSYAFLGVRLECAQCHKHPFDQWTQTDFNRFGAFFNVIGVGISPESRAANKKLTEELGLDKLVGGERNRKINALRRDGQDTPWQEIFVTKNNKPARVAKVKPADQSKDRVLKAKILGGEEVSLNEVDDPRTLIVEWLRSPTNPYFARAFVNRVWANDFGSGIVNPPDDMNMANPPSNAPLLDYLAKGFVEHHFDMKWLHREIMTSQTYQRSWRTEPSNVGDERNFSHALIRRLPAEVLIDALAQATTNTPTLLNVASDVETRAIGPRPANGRGEKQRSLRQQSLRRFDSRNQLRLQPFGRTQPPPVDLPSERQRAVFHDRPARWLARRAG